MLRMDDQQLIDEDAASLYDEAPCGYLYTLPDGTLLRANATFLAWTGYTWTELSGRRFQDLLTIGGRIFHETHFAPLLHMQGHVSEIALDLVTGTGGILPILVNAVQKRDPSGRPLLNRTTVFNATDRKKYERELQLARQRAEESARAKSELLSTISHDMRSPLGAVLAAAQMLERSPLSPPQRNYLRILRSSSDTLLNLINNVLDLSRIESGQVTLESRPFDLRHLVLDLLATLNVRAEQKGLAVHVAIDDEVPEQVVGDPVKLGQILTNLAANAVKFTEAGSVAVTIRVRALTDERVELDVSVSDTGIGIPPDRLPHIFDEYTQASYDVAARYGGSGLGLAIVRRLLALHGSKAAVQSAVNEGTIFSFPLALGVGRAAAAEGIVDRRALSGVRVLLIEDNTFDAFMIGRSLAAWDVIYDVCPTVTDAETMMKEAPYDAVLLNLRLAEGDPAAAADRLKTASGRGRRAAPLILGLVPSAPDQPGAGATEGLDDAVSKPVDASLLFAKLSSVRPA